MRKSTQTNPILFDHQSKAYHTLRHDLYRGHNILTLVGVPGCGKSTILGAIAGSLYQEKHIRGVIVIVPQRSLLQNFHTLQLVTVPGSRVAKQHTLDLRGLWEETSRQGFRDYWGEEEHEHPFQIMCSQALLKRVEDLPLDLSDYLLVVDEAHRAALQGPHQTETGKLRDLWVERGGIVLQASATPWHTQSGQLVYPLDSSVYQITMGELVAAGLMPENFQVGRVQLPFEAKTLRDFLMKDSEMAIEQVAAAYQTVAEYWVKEGRPVTVMRVLQISHIEPLRRALLREWPDARIVDASGHLDDHTVELLQRARECKSWRKREIDVVIAPRRFDEGTDLPMCSDVYVIGAGYHSLRHIIQLSGRAFRSKQNITGYPKRWQNTARLVYFTPKPDPQVAHDYWVSEHGRDAVAIATYLADFEAGHMIVRDLSRVLKARLFNKKEFGPAEVKMLSKMQQLVPTTVERVEALRTVHQVKVELAAKLRVPLTRVPLKALAEELQKVNDPVRRLQASLVFALYDCDRAPRLRETILQTVQNEVEKMDPPIARRSLMQRRVSDRLTEVFTELAGEIAPEITTSVSKGFIGTLAKFTGQQATEIAALVRERIMPDPTEAEVARAIKLFHHDRKRYPSRKDGRTDAYGIPRCTWGRTDDMFKAGAFENLEGDSLAEYTRYLQQI